VFVTVCDLETSFSFSKIAYYKPRLMFNIL